MKAWKQTISTDAERIFPDPEGSSQILPGGTPHVLVEVHVLNPSGNSGTLWLGGPTTANSTDGFPLSPGESIKINAANIRLYGSCSTQQDINFLVAGAGST